MYTIKTTCTYGGKWYKAGETYDTLPDLVKPLAELKQTKVDTTDTVKKIAKPKTAKK